MLLPFSSAAPPSDIVVALVEGESWVKYVYIIVTFVDEWDDYLSKVNSMEADSPEADSKGI